MENLFFQTRQKQNKSQQNFSCTDQAHKLNKNRKSVAFKSKSCASISAVQLLWEGEMYSLLQNANNTYKNHLKLSWSVNYL